MGTNKGGRRSLYCIHHKNGEKPPAPSSHQSEDEKNGHLAKFPNETLRLPAGYSGNGKH